MARDESLVAAGLLSADEADTSRLAGLLERRVSGELAEDEFHRARAEIHARRVARREASHAAGHLEELVLREARLDLAEALAEASGDAAPYATAWQQHFDWLQLNVSRLVEAGSVRASNAPGAIDTFLRERPWPRGTAEDAERTFAPYLSPRWGWVHALDRGPEGVRRVRIVFGGATSLQTGRELVLWRGSVPVSTVRVERLERDGAVVVAEVVSHLPGSEPRAGDIATSD